MGRNKVAEEWQWILPCVVLTIGLALAALALRSTGDMKSAEFFAMFPIWATYCLIAELLWLFAYLVRLMIANTASPIAHFRYEFEWHRPLIAGFGMLLAGFNIVCFMWIKPEINRIAPFWADKAIADADHYLFGIDLWRLFDGFDLSLMMVSYRLLWFWALFLVMFRLVTGAPSQGRSVSLVNYFCLWSIFGPIGQFLMPAAGPLFYQRIGLGDRFAGLEAHVPRITDHVSNHLWTHYSEHTLGFGAGISAMPSLHVATAAWMVISLRSVGSRWTIPMAAFGLYIFVASIALGWHYAFDGLAGAACALLGDRLCRAAFNIDWSRWTSFERLRFGQPAASA